MNFRNIPEKEVFKNHRNREFIDFVLSLSFSFFFFLSLTRRVFHARYRHAREMREKLRGNQSRDAVKARSRERNALTRLMDYSIERSSTSTQLQQA